MKAQKQEATKKSARRKISHQLLEPGLKPSRIMVWMSRGSLAHSMKQRKSLSRLYPYLNPPAGAKRVGNEGVNLHAVWPIVALLALMYWWLSSLGGLGSAPNYLATPDILSTSLAGGVIRSTPTQSSMFAPAATLRPFGSPEGITFSMDVVLTPDTLPLLPTSDIPITPAPTATITSTPTMYYAPTSTLVHTDKYLNGYPNGYVAPGYEPPNYNARMLYNGQGSSIPVHSSRPAYLVVTATSEPTITPTFTP